MAYVTGDTITATEYNNFLNSTASGLIGWNHMAGTGATVYGLGQTDIPSVSANATTITASQWNALFTGMDNLVNHTNAFGEGAINETMIPFVNKDDFCTAVFFNKQNKDSLINASFASAGTVL